jgi:HEAT repeat protein
VPDLRRFRRSAQAYLDLHHQACRENDFAKRVEAQWGLIARGRDAVPILLDLLTSDDPWSREDAAAALAWLGANDPATVEALTRALRTASEDEERDSIILALGEMRSTAPVPVLAGLIRDPATDEETRGTAIEALGRIARRRFDRQPDPRAAATAWLDRREGPPG